MEKINSIKSKYGKYNSNELDFVLNVIDDKTKAINYVQKLEDEFCKKWDKVFSYASDSFFVRN